MTYNDMINDASNNALNDEPQCIHHRNTEEPTLIDVDETFLHDDQGRLLASTTKYPNIRITADYTPLVDGTTEFKNYVKLQLLPPVIDYFKAAIAVKQPLTTPLKVTASTICGFKTPAALLKGANVDFYLLVSSDKDETNWVASAGSCSLATTTKRPIVARMMFNMVYTKAASGDILGHEKNMYLTMHEMMHALGFTGSSFKNFIDASGKTRTGHIKSVSVNGVVRTVLNVEPLTSKLRSHFGCSTLPGAFLEDDGGAGTEGSHFERRHFIYDTMTSGVIHGRRITEFDFAVLEGSGWYSPNYTYTEPFYFGKGLGCNFLYQDCKSSTFKFDEFCKGNDRGCSPVGRGGGVCTVDTRSDSCSYFIPVVEYDCENPDANDYARYPTIESFGRTAGSKCFTGTLTKLTKSSQTSFCFKYTCSGTGLTTSLSVLVGKSYLKCTKEGAIKVAGYNGYLNCPDPLTFCSTIGKKFCPRGCLGRGTCVNSACKCNAGYTGVDCAYKA